MRKSVTQRLQEVTGGGASGWGVKRAENEMVRRHHHLSRHEFEQTLGDSEGKESLVCCG